MSVSGVGIRVGVGPVEFQLNDTSSTCCMSRLCYEHDVHLSVTLINRHHNVIVQQKVAISHVSGSAVCSGRDQRLCIDHHEVSRILVTYLRCPRPTFI